MKENFKKPRIYESVLFILLLSGPPRLRDRDPFASLSGSVDWSVALNMIVWFLGALWVGLSIAGMILNGRRIPKPNALHVLSFALIILLYTSVINSESVMLTLYRVTQIMLMVLFGLVWLPKFGVSSTLKHMFAGFSLLGLMIIGAAIVAPELVYSDGALSTSSLTPRQGIRGDSIANTGSVAALALIICLSFNVVKSQAMRFVFIGGFGALLILSQTRTSYAVVLLFLLLAFARFPKSVPLRLAAYLSALVVPAALVMGGGAAIMERLTRGGTNLGTLSDRTPLWEYVISETLNRAPWTGVGFYANRSITTAFNPGLGTSHSMYIEIFSGGGILSSIVFGALLIVALYASVVLFVKYGRDPAAFAVVNLLIATLLIGITSEESIVASPTSFVFWMSLSMIPMTKWILDQREQDIPEKETAQKLDTMTSTKVSSALEKPL